jgi:hypothetical protein
MSTAGRIQVMSDLLESGMVSKKEFINFLYKPNEYDSISQGPVYGYEQINWYLIDNKWLTEEEYRVFKLKEETKLLLDEK